VEHRARDSSSRSLKRCSAASVVAWAPLSSPPNSLAEQQLVEDLVEVQDADLLLGEQDALEPVRMHPELHVGKGAEILVRDAADLGSLVDGRVPGCPPLERSSSLNQLKMNMSK